VVRDTVAAMATPPDVDEALLNRVVTAVRARVPEGWGAARQATLDALTASTDAQRRSLEALAAGGVAVVTGQQAGLFGGPLYTVYKAASAVVNAAEVHRVTGVPCAPVFWLQNEDHDFDEIRTTTLLGADGAPVEVSLPADETHDGWSVARRRLGPRVDDAVDAASALLSHLPCGGEVAATLSHHWSHAVSPSSAFRGWIEQIFSGHGLLVLDPMTPAMRELAQPLHHEALARAAELSAALGGPDAEGPVHVREGAPLSFFHPEGLDGPRHRVEPAGDGRWAWVGRPGTVSSEALRGMPATTSALLRPLLQDLLLPTVAYVGGPGERAYLRQLPPLWRAFRRPEPLVVPRARFRRVDARSAKRLRQLGLSSADTERPFDEVLEQLGRAREGQLSADELVDGLLSGLPTLERFAAEAREHDPGLERSAQRVAEAFRYHAERLAGRYRRTLAREDDVSTRRMRELFAALQPGGAPQERVLGWATPAAAEGPERFVQAVLAATRPFDGTLRDLELT
jgi:bacillithiol biosynthesis cysteine-adding enzyme BshC